MGPHQICFMSLESNPKGREVKKIIGQLVFSFQGGLGVPRAQRELQLDSQFVGPEKANKAYFILLLTKTIKIKANDRVFATTHIYQELNRWNRIQRWNTWKWKQTANLWLCDWVRSVGQQMIDRSRRASKLSRNRHTTYYLILIPPKIWHKKHWHDGCITSWFNLISKQQ